jgi:mannose-6-phosphate isomerase-like protein (cupin superfamily)
MTVRVDLLPPEIHIATPTQRSAITPVTDEVIVVERPWGSFKQLVKNAEVTVKVITVQPGHRLSLQRHQRREEVWHILDQAMTVEVEDRAWVAQVGEQVRVPVGARHRLGNAGTQPARVLELAFGDFDEDDIERLADDYTR